MHLKSTKVISINGFQSKMFKEENRVSKCQEIQDAIKATLEISSVHSVLNIMQNKYWPVKIMWMLLLIASIGGCALFLTNTFFAYFSYPTVSTIDVSHDTKIVFPIISICDLNRGFTGNSSESLNSIMFACMFNTYECNLEKDFESFYNPLNGYCYRFNSQRSLNGSSTALKYTYSRGATYGLLFQMIPYQPETPVIYGSGLYQTRELGIVVFITNETLTSRYTSGVKVGLGTSTDISVKKHSIFLKPHPYSECKSGLISLDGYKSIIYKKTFSVFNGTYHYTYCANMCLQKFVGDVCKCQYDLIGPYYYSNLPACTLQMCGPSVYVQFSTNESILTSCDCPLECETHGYSWTSSTASFPNIPYAKHLYNSYKQIQGIPKINASNAYEVLQKSILSVSVFYDSIEETTINYNAKLGVTDLIGSIGGTLGLFLGMSFLSFMETFEIIFQTIIILCCSKSHEIKKVQPCTRLID